MKPQFKITPFTNPSGEQVFRVSGTMAGKQRRKNCKTQAEAIICKQNWEREAANLVPLPAITTRLTTAQAEEAEMVFRMLLGKPLTLTGAVEFALRNYKVTEKTITVNAAYPLFVADKEKSREHGLAEDTRKKYKERLARVLEAFGERNIGEITADDLEPLIFRAGSGAVNRHTDRANFMNFFNWAVAKKYCKENPVKGTTKIEVDFGQPVVLTLAQARSLVAHARTHADGRLLPFVILALFCGLRVKEITRLEEFGGWDNFHLTDKGISITLGAKVAKGRCRRVVKVPDNACMFLLPHLLAKSPFTIPNQRRLMQSLRVAAGLTEWKKDVLRHTAITFHLAQSNNENTTADWSGNSPNIIHKHYRGHIADASHVAEFWSVKPTDADGKIIPITIPTQKAA